jgi:hypothetical protein
MVRVGSKNSPQDLSASSLGLGGLNAARLIGQLEQGLDGSPLGLPVSYATAAAAG